MSPRQKKIMRKKSRDSSNRYNQKKKLEKLKEFEEHIIIEDNDDSDMNSDIADPLRVISPQSTNSVAIESPARLSPVSNISTSSERITRSVRRNIINNILEHQHNLNMEPILHRESLTPSPQSSLIENNSILVSRPVNYSNIAGKQNPAHTTTKNKSPWKYLLRKMKYRSDKELQIKDRKIQELKRMNEKYKKQVQRLSIGKSKKKKTQKLHKINEVNKSQQLHVESSKTKLKREIEKFFEEDENSRMCSGKKEYITRNKIRKQKRLLNFNLHQLHKKFIQLHPEYKLSYSFFCTLRPFWVVIPNVNARETCLCNIHENMNLAVMALKRNGIIVEKSSYEVLKSLCCDSRNMKCLFGACDSCKDKHLNYQEFDNSKECHYWFWTKSKKRYTKNGQEKFTVQSLKQQILANPKNIIEHFETLLKPYMSHCANIITQNNYFKTLKSNLKSGECIVHCDFSENYNTKYATEVQAFHFGSSRQQISLHTSVIYYLQNGELLTKSFCTLSECLRHDAVAIWEHLIPVLNFIMNISILETLHFISDSPSSQYRNRKMFYVIAKLHWNYTSLRCVIWNYSEKGHGKGAPDGVGGVLKRTADRIVAEGNDIPNIDVLISFLKDKCPGVTIAEVQESGMLEKDLLIPSDLKEFRGTMSVHQVIWSDKNPEVLAMRRLSCNLEKCSEESVHCPHGQHLGFYNIERTTLHSTGTSKTMRSKRTTVSENQIDKASTSNQNYGLAATAVQNNQSDFNIPSDDSFWTNVPSINENLISSSMSKVVTSALYGDEDSDSFDYNIF